jgi:hypothetical protein
MNKQLAKLDREEVMWKAKNGLVLNLGELSLVSGYSYAQWSSWKFRGLPLIQGKISLKRALDWIQSQEMAPETRTSQMYDLCEKMASALFDIWLALKTRQDPAKRKELCRRIDQIEAEYATLRRQINSPIPLSKFSSEPILNLPKESPPVPDQQRDLVLKSPFSEKEEQTLCKAQSGVSLNLRELATALGYSYSTMQQWKREGLPLVDGKLPKNEAWLWRKTYLAERR